MKKKKVSENLTLSERLTSRMDIPPEAASECPVFELRGRTELLITGCFGIVDFDSTKVLIKTSTGLSTIYGRGLVVLTYSDKRINIEGIIEKIILEEECDDSQAY